MLYTVVDFEIEPGGAVSLDVIYSDGSRDVIVLYPAVPIEEDCSCGKIWVGNNETQHYNWHEHCPVHGLQSVWWNSQEQVDKRSESNLRLRELQQQAREARAKVKQIDAERIRNKDDFEG